MNLVSDTTKSSSLHACIPYHHLRRSGTHLVLEVETEDLIPSMMNMIDVEQSGPK
uniref:Glycosyltransferase family 28 C-terminal domain containing protein n=1 Tax=Arundo donax TaxID=35708 RepID=A0A0A9GID5_ARUDO